MAPDRIQIRNARNSRRSFLINCGALITASALSGGVAACQAQTPPNGSEMVVYKTPTCGCCTAWVDHLTSAGLKARVVNQDDLTKIRKRLNAPDDLVSCHIAVIEGYVVEGHVPADAIKKLIAEKPAAVGIFVPGMPLGSPGMESVRGSRPFDVILLDRDGGREVFVSYGA